MYLNARGWGVQPSEFWDMTFSEYMLEAHARWMESPEGRHQVKRGEWLGKSDLSDEDWFAAQQ